METPTSYVDEFGVTCFLTRAAVEKACDDAMQAKATLSAVPFGPTTGRGGRLIWTAHAMSLGTSWAL